jgi:hypothetical protein
MVRPRVGVPLPCTGQRAYLPTFRIDPTRPDPTRHTQDRHVLPTFYIHTNSFTLTHAQASHDESLEIEQVSYY